jgi:hypothetical protein
MMSLAAQGTIDAWFHVFSEPVPARMICAMRTPRTALALLSLAALAPALAAQKGLAEPRAGLSFTPPKGWAELPADADRKATLRLFAGPNALADKAGGTHTPLLRVMFFEKGGDAADAALDVVDGLPRTTPFRSLEDFAARGLGAQNVTQEPQKVGGLVGQRVIGADVPGERVLIGQTLPLEDGAAAVCIEVLAGHAEKLKKEIDAALASLEPLARVPAVRHEAPWLADPEWKQKDAAARVAARRAWAERVVAATTTNPETGYKVSKSKWWTVLSATDAGFTKKAAAAAEVGREWLAKKLPDLTKEQPLPAVLRVFDSAAQFNAFLTTRSSTREYDQLHRELYVVNDRDNGGPTGWGPTLRAVLWQIFDDVDPLVLPVLPRWLDNGCWEFLRSTKLDGKKLEFLSGEVERGRIDYYRQNDRPMPALWDLIQEHMQVSPTDGSLEPIWGYTPECARLLRWLWMHDGQAAFEKPNLVSDYVKALGVAHANLGPDPTADVPLVGLSEAQQKERNTRYYKWRDAMLVEANNIAVPLQVDTWKSINAKWLEFNKGFK